MRMDALALGSVKFLALLAVLTLVNAGAEAALTGRIDGGYSKGAFYGQTLQDIPDRTFLRRIKGYAYDDQGAGVFTQVSLDLYINGSKVSTQVANRSRIDVQTNLGLIDDKCGFDFDLPPLTPGSTSYTLDVKETGTTTSLPGITGENGGGPPEPDYTTPRASPAPFRYYRWKALPMVVPLKGVRAEYFDDGSGFTLTRPRVMQVDPDINFNFNNFINNGETPADYPLPPPPAPPPNGPGPQSERPHELVQPYLYGMLWTADILPLYTETYQIAFEWDDNLHVQIDGVNVIAPIGCCNNTGAPNFVNAGWYGNVNLVAGRRHELQVVFVEGGGGSQIKMWWKSPSQPLQKVPNSQLFPNRVPRVDKSQLATTSNSLLYSVNEDASININIVAYDPDSFLGDSFTNQLLTLPVNGTLGGGFPNFTYTPFPNFYGTDQFTFRMNDQIEDSPIYTVRITVTPQDDVLTPTTDLYTVLEDTASNLAVLSNDNAVDAPITVVIVTPPTRGIASVNANGTISYTPNPNYFGPDSFVYRATDGDGQTGTALVDINVLPVNDSPVAGADAITANQDLPRTVATSTLLANDSDPVEGETITITAVSAGSGAGGTVSLSSGIITYTPPLGFFGSDYFTYTLTDASGGTATGNVSVTVSQAPLFSSSGVTATPNPTVTGQQVFFSATVTFPQGPGPITWDFADGTTATGAAVTHGFTNAGVYTVVCTAFDADGGRAKASVQVLVSFNIVGESGSGAANPPGAGILIGGPGVGVKSGGVGKIVIDYLNKDRTVFSGTLGKIRFPTNITQEALQGKAGILKVGTDPLSETFIFTLSAKGKGVATALSTVEINVSKGAIKFKTGNRPRLTAIAEAAGAPYDPDTRALRTVRLPVSLVFDNMTNFALAMTYQMVVKQVKTTAKGATK